MHSKVLRTSIDRFWDDEALPALADYIAIPALSPAFDADWKKTGAIAGAVEFARAFVARHLPHAKIVVQENVDAAPALLVEVPGTKEGTVFLYGHLDKQPPGTGWDEGLGAWMPVRRGDRLYGRGAADDGYAVFAMTAVVKALEETPHPRLVFFLECEEESGSPNLASAVERAAAFVGTPDLIVCLDSGCATYDALWLTTTLRGALIGTLDVRVLTEGVHSGEASGVVPSSFRILRLLLDRLEDAATGRILPAWLHVEIPPASLDEARSAAAIIGGDIVGTMPFAAGVRPMSDDPLELLLNRTWRPTLSVTGQEGIPSVPDGGNVLRPHTTLKLSVRIPPTLPVAGLAERLKELFEADPPYGAKVTFEAEDAAAGYVAPPLDAAFERLVNEASETYYGKPLQRFGEGGSIPFMGMLGERYPDARFLITGVLGPQSNAHGPNEFLHVPAAKNLSAALAHIIRNAEFGG